MKHFKYIVLFLLIVACTDVSQQQIEIQTQFSSELDALKEYFNIPGVAVTVMQNDNILYEDFKGFANVEDQMVLDATHVFPIASLTKVFTGVAIMKLVEDKKLNLEEPLKNYFPEAKNISDSIQIKHVLSHTSQGDIGNRFYYSSRFGALTKVIEQASGVSFKDYIETEIFVPIGLQNSFLLKDSTQVAEMNVKLAEPYVLLDGVQRGFVDYGYSSSAGIVSNLQDLQRFNNALDVNTLISEASKKQLFTSFKENLPYGYGIFNQKIHGVEVVWAYGQYDCYSSLFLKVPEKNLTLILLANNNLMSDPARLIYGDVSSSLFALSFLKNYVWNASNVTLLESDSVAIDNPTDFYRSKLLAQALSESFMARFDASKVEKSAALLETVFSTYPNYLDYGTINLLHTMLFLKDVSFYRELGEFNRFDSQIEALGTKLLQEDPQNPYLNGYFGNYYLRKGEDQKARFYFEQITQAKNFSRNWYTVEAENALKSISQE
jgi:CubicO group peptidase (beta-lactamase class C family)